MNTYYVWDTIENVIRSGYGDKDDMVRYARNLNSRVDAMPSDDPTESKPNGRE